MTNPSKISPCEFQDHLDRPHHHGGEYGKDYLVHRHPGCPGDCGMAVYQKLDRVAPTVKESYVRMTLEKALEDLKTVLPTLKAKVTQLELETEDARLRVATAEASIDEVKAALIALPVEYVTEFLVLKESE